MNTNMKNQIKIKIFGNLKAIKYEAERIKQLYPVYIESDYMLNDDGVTSRVYLTVPINQESNSCVEALSL